MSVKQNPILAYSALAALLIFVVVGVLLVGYAHDYKAFDVTQPVCDLQWLNAYSLMFLAVLAIVWHRIDSRRKTFLSLVCLAVWGAVAVSLIVGHTHFPFNGFVGDQQIRIGMVRKFMTFALPTDFFYHGLPPFYPPLYFWLVSLMGRILGIEAHFAVREGSLVLTLAGPFLLYWLWRKLVTRLQALAIVIGTFLLYPWAILGSPHEFIAFSFFIPWWVHYVEQVRLREFTWKTVTIGGLIGGALFMTYYYAFFIGAVVIVARLFSLAGDKSLRIERWRRFRRSLSVLAAAAVVSAVYWVPLAISMIRHGAYAAQSRWFHIAYADMKFAFTLFTIPGVLYLIAMFYALTRYRQPLYRSILLLIAGAPVVLVIGYVLGNLDHPILYLKAVEFLLQMAGVCIGLGFVAFYRALRHRPRFRIAVPVLGLIIMLPLINGFTAMTNDGASATGRKTFARFPQFREVPGIDGSVVLTDFQELGVFVPSYAFNSLGEHYAHPAGQFHQRFQFLAELQAIDDPYLFWLALRYNRFDPIDFITPHLEGDQYQIRYILSYYPERNMASFVRFNRRVLEDTTYVTNVNNLVYAVSNDSPSADRVPIDSPTFSPLQSAQHLLVRRNLTEEGQRKWDAAVEPDNRLWSIVYVPDCKGYTYSRDIRLISILSTPEADSLHIVFGFLVTGEIKRDLRAFFHVYSSGRSAAFENHDFSFTTPTSKARPGDMLWCERKIARPSGAVDFHLGLFDGGGRLGEGFWGKLPLGCRP